MTGAGLNLLALLPCPVKVPFEEAFEGFLATLTPERAASLTCRLEGNANIESEYYSTLEHISELSELPDIVISPGFNSFFEPAFVSRFIQTGKFSSVDKYAGDRHLSKLGVCDPSGHYSMLAMNLLVPVVDHKRLGNRPVPRSWSDLLSPEYEQSIAIRGHKDGTFCETLLLTIFKDSGIKGLHSLGRNVRYGWHPSQMVKAALGSSVDAPAISVMPLFFAQNLKGKDQYSVVWPEDGALISPVTMLVKTEKLVELDDLISFLAGPQVAGIFAGAFFPAVHPEVDNKLPEDATFKWIGWDYVTSQDIKELIDSANCAFRSGREGH